MCTTRGVWQRYGERIQGLRALWIGRWRTRRRGLWVRVMLHGFRYDRDHWQCCTTCTRMSNSKFYWLDERCQRRSRIISLHTSGRRGDSLFQLLRKRTSNTPQASLIVIASVTAARASCTATHARRHHSSRPWLTAPAAVQGHGQKQGHTAGS